MKIHYDKSIDALSIRFNEKRYIESDEIRDGVIFDYDDNSNIIGIELLNASKIVGSKDKINFARNIPVTVS